MLAGVISDTHGYFDERVLPHFAWVDLILHAGDIGSMEVLERLGEIAPVFAVEGNNDEGLGLGVELRLSLNLEGHRVQVVHQLPHAEPGSDVVVHGHSHKLLNEWSGETLYVNPGAAGRRGFHALQSIALLRLELGMPPEAELIVLGPRLASGARPRRSSR
jgi:putative phosphoesterase